MSGHLAEVAALVGRQIISITLELIRAAIAAALGRPEQLTDSHLQPPQR